MKRIITAVLALALAAPVAAHAYVPPPPVYKIWMYLGWLNDNPEFQDLPFAVSYEYWDEFVYPE
jgi:hypothetical protein